MKNRVALRKESVDRNNVSLSLFANNLVALRKESVDRNEKLAHLCLKPLIVALRKESVDRNERDHLQSSRNSRRSPQGERG